LKRTYRRSFAFRSTSCLPHARRERTEGLFSTASRQHYKRACSRVLFPCAAPLAEEVGRGRPPYQEQERQRKVRLFFYCLAAALRTCVFRSSNRSRMGPTLYHCRTHCRPRCLSRSSMRLFYHTPRPVRSENPGLGCRMCASVLWDQASTGWLLGYRPAGCRSSRASSQPDAGEKEDVPLVGNVPASVRSPVRGSIQVAWTAPGPVSLSIRTEIAAGLLR